MAHLPFMRPTKMTIQVYRLNLIARSSRSVTVDNTDNSMSANEIVSALWEREGSEVFAEQPMSTEGSETSFLFDEPAPGTYDGLWPQADAYYKVRSGQLHFHCSSPKFDISLPSPKGLGVFFYALEDKEILVVNDDLRARAASFSQSGIDHKFEWGKAIHEVVPPEAKTRPRSRLKFPFMFPEKTFVDWVDELGWTGSEGRLLDLTGFSALAYCVWLSGKHQRVFWELVDWFAYPVENPRAFTLDDVICGDFVDPTIGVRRSRLSGEHIILSEAQKDSLVKFLSGGCQVKTKMAADNLANYPRRYDALSDWWTRRIHFVGNQVNYCAAQDMTYELKSIRSEIRNVCT